MSKPQSIILLSGNGSNLKNIINKKTTDFLFAGKNAARKKAINSDP